RVSTGLPLLGEGRWGDARQHLKFRDKPPRDELSTLEDAALTLASQLEFLDTASRDQQNDLAKLVDTLSHERDFISSLLDTAQALILTLDRHGVIRMVNDYVETLTGLTESQLIGQDYFVQMIAPQESRDWRSRLLVHFVEDPAPLRFEALLATPDGLRNITWVHSLIGQESGNEPLILSVGLDLTELKSAQARASYLSEYDTLTGLYNRQGFQRRLAHALTELKGGGALLLIDLDDFKAINDLAGYSAGDTMIQHMAERLRELKPVPKLAARLGGDEFVLFFEPLPDAQLLQTARFLCTGDRGRHLATSCVGIAVVQPVDTTESLLGHADLALSNARAKGRSNWHLYNPADGTRESLLDRTEQLAVITDALHDDRLMLFLQPITAIQAGSTSHYEVLLRVRMPDGKILPPAPLIVAAEASGLIREIDLWVLRHTIALIARHPGLRLAANLSGRSLDNPELPTLLQGMLQEYGVNPQQLILEITETATLNLTDAEILLTGIRALGCKLALDDFGVGFSTFQYLKHLPVDYVKIDGSFIRTLDHSEDDRLFVKVLVEAIHGYGKLAVAEYVETPAILQWVTELGVDYAQGYHFGRPQAADEVLAPKPG
ncbi:MAG: EAL domain-containing protein, partial [Thiobacillus sp.]|nr:EAL domain-containing protein [Thiobacillus sp.]